MFTYHQSAQFLCPLQKRSLIHVSFSSLDPCLLTEASLLGFTKMAGNDWHAAALVGIRCGSMFSRYLRNNSKLSLISIFAVTFDSLVSELSLTVLLYRLHVLCRSRRCVLIFPLCSSAEMSVSVVWCGRRSHQRCGEKSQTPRTGVHLLLSLTLLAACNAL